jgi:hypothetical protein
MVRWAVNIFAELSNFSSPTPSNEDWLTMRCCYNPGKKLVDFLNFQTFSPSPHIKCWYLGDMCCKSTLPKPTLFVWGGGGLRWIVALIEKCSHFHNMFSILDVYFEKSTHIFSKIVWKNTMANHFTKLIVPSFSKHNFQIIMDSIFGTLFRVWLNFLKARGWVDRWGLRRCPALRKIAVNLSSKVALTKNYGS